MRSYVPASNGFLSPHARTACAVSSAAAAAARAAALQAGGR
ncbi:hypothetical protein [Streptomyces sp. YIM 130001]|nr:hypothetical protein [Streptomyces sp. YIM 130001]